MRYHSQSGNVFIYIFLAIALFGALTFALSQGSRTGSASLTNEQAQIAANELLRQADTVNRAYQKIRLRGFKEDEVNFTNSVSTIIYSNGRCSSEICQIFNLKGGAINFPVAPANANGGEEWFFTGQTPIRYSGGSSFRYDLVMYLPNINEAVCKKLNIELGITSDMSDPIPVDDNPSLYINRYTGGIDASSNYLRGTNIDGEMAVCLRLNNLAGPISTIGPSNAYYFVNTIYAG